jgi:hypothetical protein
MVAHNTPRRCPLSVILSAPPMWPIPPGPGDAPPPVGRDSRRSCRLARDQRNWRHESTGSPRQCSRLAEQEFADKDSVEPIDDMRGLGWLAPVRVEGCRGGRVPVLKGGVPANLSKSPRPWPTSTGGPGSPALSRARPSTCPPPRRCPLQFSVRGELSIEEASRTDFTPSIVIPLRPIASSTDEIRRADRRHGERCDKDGAR